MHIQFNSLKKQIIIMQVKTDHMNFHLSAFEVGNFAFELGGM